MKHFMIDMETLGLGDRPVITSMGFTEFDILTGETTRYEEYSVDARSCVSAGGKVDGSTVEWWLRQDPKVFYENVIVSLNSGVDGDKEISVGDAIIAFSEFIKRSLAPKEDFRIWSNGNLADAKWLESYVDALNIRDKVCWGFWQFNDVRTIVDLGWQVLEQDFKKTTVFEGKRHDPIDDCRFQALYVSNIYCKFKHLYNSDSKTAKGISNE